MPRCRMDSFCLPVAGWPLAGASFLFLRAGAATTKFSPYHQQTATHLPAPWLLVALSLGSCITVGGSLKIPPLSDRPRSFGQRQQNPTPRRHRPGRPLSCRPRALLCPQQTAQSVPHAGFNRPSTLCARSQPAGQHSPAPPLHFSVGVFAAKSNPRKDASSRVFAPRVCWRVAAQSAAGWSASPHVKGSRGGSPSFVLPTTHHPPPRPTTPSPASFSPRHHVWFVCVCLSACAPPGPPRGSRPLESCIIGEPVLWAVYPAAHKPATVHPPLALVQDAGVAADWLRRAGRDGEQHQHLVHDISGSK